MPLSLTNMTIKKAREGLLQGDFSAVELSDAYLRAIDKDDKEIHAYVEVYEDVKKQAAAADTILASKKDASGILTGIPIAMKDNILIEGKLASAGSKILENYRATYDADATQKLKEAGAVFLGRTNMDEFAMGSSCETSAYGPTKNPHDMTRVPGGSSGGSAAAVAKDLALVALGSDTGGSIRQPAALCGVVGLKPTYGTVSRSGLMALASSFDQIGPFAKTVEDAEILYNCMKGNDPKDSTSLPESAFKETKKAKNGKYVIGVPEKFLEKGVEKDVLLNFRASLQALEKAGHEVRKIDLPNIEYALAVYYIIMPAEASSNLARHDGIRYGRREEGKDLWDVYKKTRGEGFGAEVRRRMILGTYVLSAGYYDAYYNKAVAARQRITKDFEEAFENIDIVATPTTTSPAFVLGEKTSDPLSMYLEDLLTVQANIAGLPAISLPSGFVKRDGKDLPVGLHLTAPALAENSLFILGKEFLREN